MLAYLSEKRNAWLTQSLLECSSDSKCASSVRKLLAAGMSFESLLALTDANGWTVLQLAALHNHINTIIALRDYPQSTQSLQSDAPRNMFLEACEHQGVCGMSTLLVALASGHETLACVLLEAGVSTTPTGSRARNCLYLLCRANLLVAFECLLRQHGVTEVARLAAAPDTNGYNALHAIVLAGHVAMCDTLLATGGEGEVGRACLHRRSKDDSNVFHLVARLSKIQPCTRTSREMTAVLLKHLQSLSRSQKEGEEEEKTQNEGLGGHETPFDDGLKQMLLAADCFGSTPLHVASVTANSACLQLLLQSTEGRGRVLVACDNDGYHPPSIAAAEFCRIVTEFQREYPGQSLFWPDTAALPLPHPEGSSVVKGGCKEGEQGEDQQELRARELRDRGFRLVECMMVLLAEGYPLKSADYSGNTLLHSLAHCPPGEALSQVLKALISTRQEVGETTIDNPSAQSEAFRQVLEVTNDNDWSCFHVALSHLPLSPPTDPVLSSEAVAGSLEYDTDGAELRTFHSVLFPYTSTEFQTLFDPTKPKTVDPSRQLRAQGGAHRRMPAEERFGLLQGDYTLGGVVQFLHSLPHTPRVVVVAGAGISTSAGIPDFRSSGTGLYANSATAELFSTDFLFNRTEQFFEQLKTLFLPVVDGAYKPTTSHALLRLLHDCGWLTRVYTQNIDMLEAAVFEEQDTDDADDVSLLEEKVVECHGTMRRFRCTAPLCLQPPLQRKAAMQQHVWNPLREGKVPVCPMCRALLRPDVTFFGEPLPERFHSATLQDLPGRCDLLLVMGTSLLVHPVAGLPQLVGPTAVRMLWNRDPSGCFQFIPPGNVPSPTPLGADPITGLTPGQLQSESRGYRDVFHRGDCDSAAMEFAELIGKKDELEALLARYHSHQATLI